MDFSYVQVLSVSWFVSYRIVCSRLLHSVQTLTSPNIFATKETNFATRGTQFTHNNKSWQEIATAIFARIKTILAIPACSYVTINRDLFP
jgi:hypothetical protein